MLALVLRKELRVGLPEEPVLAPGRRVNFCIRRLVINKVERLIHLILANPDNIRRRVHEDAADVLRLTFLAFLEYAGLHGLLDLEVFTWHVQNLLLGLRRLLLSFWL